MTDPRKPAISLRKRPKQARSNELLSIILQAATQVLAKEGAARFTTARVAEKAGVSIGSLYQYFPNKAAILFRLQSDEWRQTTALLSEILGDTTQAPQQRLRTLVQVFIKSECEEADMRIALDDAAPLYRNAPEAQEVKATGAQAIQRFMLEVLPDATEAVRAQAGELIKTTMSTVGKEFSQQPRTESEIDDFAHAMADMFCAYLERLGSA